MSNILINTMPFDVNPDIIKESIKENNGVLIVRGKLQSADKKNQNGRVYPRKILEREVKSYMQKIRERSALGELDHPDSSVVNLKNVSHIIKEIHWDGNDVMGTIEVLDTPSGRILKKLFEHGVRVGISSRAHGSTVTNESNNYEEVQDDLKLIAWDFVSDPSTHGAWMNPVNENVDYSKKKSNQKLNTLISELLNEV